MQIVAYSLKPMIPGLIVKSHALQPVAKQGSKFQSEVSPEVSPEMWYDRPAKRATRILTSPLPETRLFFTCAQAGRLLVGQRRCAPRSR
jgi:hypothetical protein